MLPFLTIMAATIIAFFGLCVVAVCQVWELIAECDRLRRRVERLHERLSKFERWIHVP